MTEQRHVAFGARRWSLNCPTMRRGGHRSRRAGRVRSGRGEGGSAQRSCVCEEVAQARPQGIVSGRRSRAEDCSVVGVGERLIEDQCWMGVRREVSGDGLCECVWARGGAEARGDRRVYPTPGFRRCWQICAGVIAGNLTRGLATRDVRIESPPSSRSGVWQRVARLRDSRQMWPRLFDVRRARVKCRRVAQDPARKASSVHVALN